MILVCREPIIERARAPPKMFTAPFKAIIKIKEN